MAPRVGVAHLLGDHRIDASGKAAVAALRTAPAERLVGRLAATFRTAEARSVDPAMIAQAEASLMQLSNEIALRYFTHRGGGGDSDGFDA